MPPAAAEHRVVGGDLLDERGGGVDAGVGGEQPRRVGEQHEHVGGDEVGDEGGDAVVVAEAELVGGDGVVLVDDRHAAQLEQAGEGLAGVEVLAAVDEVLGSSSTCAPTSAVVAEDVVVDLHEAALAGGRQRLERGQVGRAGGEAEGGHARRHGAARHDARPVAGGAQGDHLLAQLHDGAEVDDAALVGERRRADLGHDGAHVSRRLRSRS